MGRRAPHTFVPAELPGHGGLHGEIRQGGVQDREVCNAPPKERHVEERFRAHGEEPEAGHRNRAERGSKQGGQGAQASIGAQEQRVVADQQEALANLPPADRRFLGSGADSDCRLLSRRAVVVHERANRGQ